MMLKNMEHIVLCCINGCFYRDAEITIYQLVKVRCYDGNKGKHETMDR